MNALLSRLAEQQRRWYAALEATRLGHDGAHLMAQSTGLDPQTIQCRRREWASKLRECPVARHGARGVCLSPRVLYT